MGISRLSALTIGSNPTEVITYSNQETIPKFGAAICHSKDHPHHPLLQIVSSECVFDTQKEAKETLEKLKQDIKDFMMNEDINEEVAELKRKKDQNGTLS